MYLYKLKLHPKQGFYAIDAKKGYEFHQMMARCFGELLYDDHKQPTQRILFRLEEKGVILLTSTQSLDFEKHFPEETSVEYKSYPPLIPADKILRFSLRANPTKALKTPNGRGIRQALWTKITPEEHKTLSPKALTEIRKADYQSWINWLHQKAEIHGFKILDVQAQNSIAKQGTKTHFTVDFNGTLQVTDAARFQETLLQGIGKGKAFGFGMLCVAPA
jgi:CRISPR system Cascade subunit CasE